MKVLCRSTGKRDTVADVSGVVGTQDARVGRTAVSSGGGTENEMEDGVEGPAATNESGNETEKAPESNAADGVSTEPAEAEDGIDGIVHNDTDLGRKQSNVWPKRN